MLPSATPVAFPITPRFCHSALAGRALAHPGLSAEDHTILENAAALQPAPQAREALRLALGALGATPITPYNFSHLVDVLRAMPPAARGLNIQAEAARWIDRHPSLPLYLGDPGRKSMENIYAAALINTRFLLQRMQQHDAVQVTSTLYISLLLASIDMSHPGLRHHFYPLRFTQRHDAGPAENVYEILLFDNLQRLDRYQRAALADPANRMLDVARIRLGSVHELCGLLHDRKYDVLLVDPASQTKLSCLDGNVEPANTMDSLYGILDRAGLDAANPLAIDVMWPACRCNDLTPTPSRHVPLIDLA